MDRALNYLALAKKGRLIELGEEPVGAITRAVKARLVIVASDASDHTWRRAKSFVAGTEQQCIRVPFTKEELGFVVGRTSLAIAALTDAALAVAFVKALPDQEKVKDVLAKLEEKAKKLRQRRDEAKAHERNVRFGKKK
ncbi:MAG: 50S ribosomal protein L7 [Oscillospiraceae bacterium]|nr:50S ribosomal protein L7 [Oscillospiraceae bacterium]